MTEMMESFGGNAAADPHSEKMMQLVCGTSEEEDSSSIANFLSVGLMILCSLLKM